MIANSKKVYGQFMNDLRQQGYTYDDPNEIFRLKSVDLPVVKTILKWLPALYSEHYGTADIMARSLISAKEPFDPTVLIDLFDNSDLNFYLKTAIGYALANIRYIGLDERSSFKS